MLAWRILSGATRCRDVLETRERDLAHERSPSQMRDDLHLGLAAVTGYEVFIYTNMCLLSEP